jgi:hypothetical protein
MVTQYEKHKQRAAERSRQQSAAGRDIGPIPAVVNPERRAACKFDLKLFCKTYLPSRFSLPFGENHIETLAIIERVCLDGGQFAFAMPRGEGKTTQTEAGALWSAIYGHRKFIAVIGSTETHAENILDSIKAEIETNDLLLEDFPEVCYPVRSLEGIHNRASGQTCGGQRTRIEWSQKRVSFPTIEGSRASGCRIWIAGLTGAIRGMKATQDGATIRPDLVILDDPQTDESAYSPIQNIQREKIVSRTVLGLAGPGKKIAALMPSTVIAPGDMVDKILDNKRNPQWNGRRFGVLRKWPKNMKLWEQYREILGESHRQGLGRKLATEFYEANRAEMDEGAEASWAERHEPDQISAIQNALEWFLTNPAGFFAEGQNEPRELKIGGEQEPINGSAVIERLTRLSRGTAPIDTTLLTSMVDVQGEILYYAVGAWNANFGGSIIDYGTYPEQHAKRFVASDPRPSLSDVYPDLPSAARIYQALTDLSNILLTRQWPRDGGGSLNIERMLVDSGWETDAIYRWSRETPHKSIVIPSKGRSAGATSTAFADYTVRPGDRAGENWHLTASTGALKARLLQFDANYWKSFLAERLATPLGIKSALMLFGEQSREHEFLSEHLQAEYPVLVTAPKLNRTVTEWKPKPGRPENHWFDCLVGVCVAASLSGLRIVTKDNPQQQKAKVKLSDIQKKKRRGE